MRQFTSDWVVGRQSWQRHAAARLPGHGGPEELGRLHRQVEPQRADQREGRLANLGPLGPSAPAACAPPVPQSCVMPHCSPGSATVATSGRGRLRARRRRPCCCSWLLSSLPQRTVNTCRGCYQSCWQIRDCGSLVFRTRLSGRPHCGGAVRHCKRTYPRSPIQHLTSPPQRSRGRACDRVSTWSGRHCARAVQWDAHVRRTRNSDAWLARLLAYRDRELFRHRRAEVGSCSVDGVGLAPVLRLAP